jgi:hypothetical protein
MKSISGFNNSSLQGSSDSFLVNKIGAGVDIAKTAMSNDVQFQTSTGGTSYSMPQQVYDFQAALNFKQFDCIVQKLGTVHHLKIVNGTVPYIYSTSDLGYVSNVAPYFYDIDRFNLFPTGIKTNGTDSGSIFLNDNGYLTLTPGTDYVVFVYMVGPQYQPDGSDGYEFIIPQLAVSKIGDDPEKDINSGTTSGRTYEIVTELNIGITSSVNYLFKNTFSVRANIATIQWDSADGVFYVNQITNYPNLNYIPFISGATTNSPSFDSSTVNTIINGYTGYTKELNEDAIGYDVVQQGEM